MDKTDLKITNVTDTFFQWQSNTNLLVDFLTEKDFIEHSTNLAYTDAAQIWTGVNIFENDVTFKKDVIIDDNAQIVINGKTTFEDEVRFIDRSVLKVRGGLEFRSDNNFVGSLHTSGGKLVFDGIFELDTETAKFELPNREIWTGSNDEELRFTLPANNPIDESVLLWGENDSSNPEHVVPLQWKSLVEFKNDVKDDILAGVDNSDVTLLDEVLPIGSIINVLPEVLADTSWDERLEYDVSGTNLDVASKFDLNDAFPGWLPTDGSTIRYNSVVGYQLKDFIDMAAGSEDETDTAGNPGKKLVLPDVPNALVKVLRDRVQTFRLKSWGPIFFAAEPNPDDANVPAPSARKVDELNLRTPGEIHFAYNTDQMGLAHEVVEGWTGWIPNVYGDDYDPAQATDSVPFYSLSIKERTHPEAGYFVRYDATGNINVNDPVDPTHLVNYRTAEAIQTELEEFLQEMVDLATEIRDAEDPTAPPYKVVSLGKQPLVQLNDKPYNPELIARNPNVYDQRFLDKPLMLTEEGWVVDGTRILGKIEDDVTYNFPNTTKFVEVKQHQNGGFAMDDAGGLWAIGDNSLGQIYNLTPNPDGYDLDGVKFRPEYKEFYDVLVPVTMLDAGGTGVQFQVNSLDDVITDPNTSTVIYKTTNLGILSAWADTTIKKITRIDGDLSKIAAEAYYADTRAEGPDALGVYLSAIDCGWEKGRTRTRRVPNYGTGTRPLDPYSNWSIPWQVFEGDWWDHDGDGAEMPASDAIIEIGKDLSAEQWMPKFNGIQQWGPFARFETKNDIVITSPGCMLWAIFSDAKAFFDHLMNDMGFVSGVKEDVTSTDPDKNTFVYSFKYTNSIITKEYQYGFNYENGMIVNGGSAPEEPSKYYIKDIKLANTKSYVIVGERTVAADNSWTDKGNHFNTLWIAGYGIGQYGNGRPAPVDKLAIPTDFPSTIGTKTIGSEDLVQSSGVYDITKSEKERLADHINQSSKSLVSDVHLPALEGFDDDDAGWFSPGVSAGLSLSTLPDIYDSYNADGTKADGAVATNDPLFGGVTSSRLPDYARKHYLLADVSSTGRITDQILKPFEVLEFRAFGTNGVTRYAYYAVLPGIEWEVDTRGQTDLQTNDNRNYIRLVRLPASTLAEDGYCESVNVIDKTVEVVPGVIFNGEAIKTDPQWERHMVHRILANSSLPEADSEVDLFACVKQNDLYETRLDVDGNVCRSYVDPTNTFKVDPVINAWLAGDPNIEMRVRRYQRGVTTIDPCGLPSMQCPFMSVKPFDVDSDYELYALQTLQTTQIDRCPNRFERELYLTGTYRHDDYVTDEITGRPLFGVGKDSDATYTSHNADYSWGAFNVGRTSTGPMRITSRGFEFMVLRSTDLAIENTPDDGINNKTWATGWGLFNRGIVQGVNDAANLNIEYWNYIDTEHSLDDRLYSIEEINGAAGQKYLWIDQNCSTIYEQFNSKCSYNLNVTDPNKVEFGLFAGGTRGIGFEVDSESLGSDDIGRILPSVFGRGRIDDKAFWKPLESTLDYDGKWPILPSDIYSQYIKDDVDNIPAINRYTGEIKPLRIAMDEDPTLAEPYSIPHPIEYYKRFNPLSKVDVPVFDPENTKVVNILELPRTAYLLTQNETTGEFKLHVAGDDPFKKATIPHYAYGVNKFESDFPLHDLSTTHTSFTDITANLK